MRDRDRTRDGVRDKTDETLVYRVKGRGYKNVYNKGVDLVGRLKGV